MESALGFLRRGSVSNNAKDSRSQGNVSPSGAVNNLAAWLSYFASMALCCKCATEIRFLCSSGDLEKVRI